MLADNGMDQEGIALVRVMLEHTIMLHWIVERGDDGIDAMRANQSKQMTRTFDRARGTAMEVPEAIAGEITASFDGVDATKAASNFSKICGEVGCGDLYWVYGILSQSVHPSVSTSNAYIEAASGALRLTPRLGYPASVQMIARCVIWAQRALDRLVPDPARAQGLEKLASAIGAVPVLPGYQPPAPPTSRGPGGRRDERSRPDRLVGWQLATARVTGPASAAAGPADARQYQRRRDERDDVSIGRVAKACLVFCLAG